jgi:TonB family protein
VQKRLSFHLVAVLVAVLGAGVARADLYEAAQAYDKQDHETAFRLYRELAELGQVYAQEHVASMYVDGEGVKRDNVSGYAWASIALENGGADAEVMRSIIKQLDPYMTPNNRKRVDDIRAQFGREALTKALLPNIFQNANYMDREPCHLTKGETGIYPEEAQDKGIQGNAYVEFTVMPDGRARNPRVIYSVPTGFFEEAARVAILKSEFSPARTKQGLVPCTMSMMFRYVLDVDSKEYPRLEVLAKETLAKAEAGDPRAQMLYGLLISGMPQLKQTRSDAMPWFLKSAQAGMPTAQFTIGYSILQGWGCECDEPKGLVWLHKAAAADQSDAQVALANYLLRGDPSVEDVAKARKWLERAVDHGNRDAKYYLAALLAAGVDPASRDPQRSLLLLKEVMSDVNQDPTTYEIRAAAYAMLGKFPEAQKDQEKALRIAERLKWETATQQARLASYQQKNPWTGDLFAF